MLGRGRFDSVDESQAPGDESLKRKRTDSVSGYLSSNLPSLSHEDNAHMSQSGPGSALYTSIPAPSPNTMPRRSPRTRAADSMLFTPEMHPAFSLPSPTLPPIYSNMRRSPRLLAAKGAMSPSSSFLTPLDDPGDLMSPGLGAFSRRTPGFQPVQVPDTPGHFTTADGKNTAGSSSQPELLDLAASSQQQRVPTGNMSILNKLQQSGRVPVDDEQQEHSTKDPKRRKVKLGDKLKRSSYSAAMLSRSPPVGSVNVSAKRESIDDHHGGRRGGSRREDDDEEEQMPETSMAPPMKMSGNGSGSSCHQCKSRRGIGNLIFCCNMFKRSGKNKQRKDRRHACRKKYCDQCLMKFYHEKAPTKRQDPNSTWNCPACRGLCCCAACRRQKAKLERGADPMRMSPATSLACGLVYFKDMLKFKLGNGPEANDDLRKVIQNITSEAPETEEQGGAAASSNSGAASSTAAGSVGDYNSPHPSGQPSAKPWVGARSLSASSPAAHAGGGATPPATALGVLSSSQMFGGNP